jgi:NiFe hydrogenase small subunit HydA
MSTGEISIFPRLTRREFLKYCGTLAALIGAGEAAIPDIAAALEKLAKRPAVVWSLFQECLGCSVSLLQSRTPDVANLILRQISLEYHEAVMAAAGDQAHKHFEDMVESGDFYYVVEGAIATKIPEAITMHGITAADHARETYKKAKATIAIGSCATFGGIQAASPNPTGAKGLTAFLREDAGVANPVVVNISRCPGNAEDMLAALTYILVHGKPPELDAVGRPVFLYDHLIHDDCDRRGHFDAGEFVEVFGDEASQERWCLYKVGCKGPQTYAPCPKTRWNGHVSWCVHNGPCIGCAEPEFWDKLTPFYERAQNVQVPGIGGISTTRIGMALGAATAVGLGAHLIGQAATGRLGKGGPPEPEESPRGGRS